MQKTSIEWVKNPDGTPGYAWNPITGCLNGCPYCYARKLANTRLKERYLANENIAPNNALRDSEIDKLIRNDPFYPRFWEDKIGEPIWYPSTFRNRHPHSRGIFVCDMSDLFGIGIPEKWTEQVLDVIKACHYHRFYLLTKQPQNLAKFSPFPENCYVGVSVTDMPMFRQAMKGLIDIQAKVKYISFEPLLEHIFVDPISFKGFYEYANMPNTLIQWVIIGTQTGTKNELRKVLSEWNQDRNFNIPSLTITHYRGNKWTLQPSIEWVKEIVEAADKAGVAVFLKNNLKPLFHKHLTVDDKWAMNPEKDWPERGIWRQEMPND